MDSIIAKPAGTALQIGDRVLILDEGNYPVAVTYGDVRSQLMADDAETVRDVTALRTLSGNTLATEPGAGITGGTGTICKTAVERVGGMIRTTIMVDLTGLDSTATTGDIIGMGTEAAYLGQITAARNGTIFAGQVTCWEVPTTGDDDIDLYAADEATGALDDAVGDLTETALLAAGGAWTLGSANAKPLTALPAADQYLYLTTGDTTAGTYDAGKLMIELWGY